MAEGWWPVRVGWRHVPVLRGVLPWSWAGLPVEVLAGLTLAALGVPEVLGYARIAGMPVVTGLYTMLVPMAVFAVLGSSRHLVVGADSATAAIAAASVGALAAPGSNRYVGWMGLAALLTGGVLVLARVARLGFLANFLSRSVLVGFLTGVGVSVAVGQLPELVGVHVRGGSSVGTLVGVAQSLGRISWPTLMVSAAVIVVVVALRLGAPRVPGALLAVVAAIVVSLVFGLPGHGVTVVGHVPGGLPSLQVPVLGVAQGSALVWTAVSMAVVILAQSSATARAYAARYGEDLDDNMDLLALGAANGAAAFTGTFVVNGSPTKTQMVDGAGGRSQLAQLSCCVVVLGVLLFATAPLGHLPNAALAAVVFVIGVELTDFPGLRTIYRVRRAEFGIAVITAAAVLAVGVERAIALALVFSLIDQLRHGYDPKTQVLTRPGGGHWHAVAATPEQRTVAGLVIYRFPSNLYYANVHRLAADLAGFASSSGPLAWFCLDCTAVTDIDFTAAEALRAAVTRLTQREVRFLVAAVENEVLDQLLSYGLLTNPDADTYPTAGAVLERYQGSR